MGKKGKWEEAAEEKVAFPVFGVYSDGRLDAVPPSHVIRSLFCMCLTEVKR